MTGRQQIYVLGLHAVIGVMVIVGATVLAALHVLDPEATTAIYGAAVGLAGGSASALASLGSAVNGKSVVSQETLNGMAANLEHAVSMLAGAREQIDRPAVTPPPSPPDAPAVPSPV